jgi:protein required for attachment to host cells
MNSAGARSFTFQNVATTLRAKSEGHGTGEELVRPKEHLEPHADSGTQATLLLGKILRPGNAGVGSPRSNIEPMDWHQLNEDRFAKDIASKLYQLAHAHRYQRLVIVAPPRVLGTLRKALNKEVLDRVEAEIPKDFAHATTSRIQEELSRAESA